MNAKIKLTKEQLTDVAEMMFIEIRDQWNWSSHFNVHGQKVRGTLNFEQGLLEKWLSIVTDEDTTINDVDDEDIDTLVNVYTPYANLHKGSPWEGDEE